MGSEPVKEVCVCATPKLSLFSLPNQPPEPPGMLTPPLQTLVSVPFQWEEAPGKPRHCSTTESKAKCARSLELPPRLLNEAAKITNMPSPTTVLDGPDVGRTLSFSFRVRNPDSLGSKRIGKESGRGGGFGSMRWGSFRKNKEVVDHGGFDFLPAAGGSGGGGGGETKVNITRVRRRASFMSVTHTKSHTWASIYESFKQVVPWRRRQEKLRKMAS
ncbi:hypothetical protein CerSpe_097630 [Prunus speciosa]